MPSQYNIVVNISVEASEAKVNAVKLWLQTNLEQRVSDGTIKGASMSISQVVVPESIVIGKP